MENSKQGSRFQCPYCSQLMSSFEALKTHVLAEHKAEPVPEPEGLINLTVNGESHSILVEPEWTLYQLLHDRMGLDRRQDVL